MKLFTRLAFVQILVSAVITGSALASPPKPTESVFRVSSKGPLATINAYSGLNTEKAAITGHIYSKNAREYCDRDPGSITTKYGGRLTLSQCINDILKSEKGRKYIISAACSYGTVRLSWPQQPGQADGRYKLRERRPRTGYNDHFWLDQATGSIVDNSEAGGGGIVNESFAMLCPGF